MLVIPSSTRSYLPFYASFLLLTLLYFVNFPSATWNAEPYAETGTDLYQRAVNEDFLSVLLHSDFVHIPILSSLIALISLQILNSHELFPVIVQIAASLVIAFSVSALALPCCRIFAKDDWMRVLICLAVGTHHGWGMHLLHNLGYWTAPVSLVITFGALLLSRKLLPLSIFGLTFLNVTGKASSIAFLPFFVLNVCCACVRKRWACACQSALLVIPLLFLINRNLSRPELQEYTITVSALTNVIILFWKSLHEVFLGKQIDNKYLNFGSFAVIATLVLSLIVLSKKKDRLGIWILMSGCAVSLASLCLTVKGFYKNPLLWSTPISFSDDSHFFFSNSAIFITVLLTICRIASSRVAYGFIVFVSLASNVFGFFSPHDPYRDSDRSPSRWTFYSKFLRDEDFCIPINPVGWYVSKRCEYQHMVKTPLTSLWNAEQKVDIRLIIIGTPAKLKPSALVIGDEHIEASRSVSIQNDTRLTYFYLTRPIPSPFAFQILDRKARLVQEDGLRIEFWGQKTTR